VNPPNRNVPSFKGAMLLALLAFARAAEAQEVFAPHHEIPVNPPAVQQVQTNSVAGSQSDGLSAGVSLPKEPFQWGPVTLRPHLQYRFLYANGIQAHPGQHVNSVINEIAPGISLGLGTHWALDYTPIKRIYSSDQFHNTLDQSVSLTGGGAYEEWIFGLAQNYVSSSMPLVETGTQTEQQTYATALTASYRFNSSLSMDLSVNQDFFFTEQFTDAREWSTLNWLNYQFWPGLDAAIGAGFGYADVDPGSDMTYEQLQGRISWRASNKITFEVHGGAEDRQFLGGNGANNLINPVFGASFQYRPFAQTSISFHADRVVAVSYFQNQVTENTGLKGVITQRLIKRLYLVVGGGYYRVKYVSSASNTIAGREDKYYSLDVRLSCSILKRGTMALFYQYSDNSSSQSQFAFSSSQAGFELGFRY
jgi:hypothetical protein